MDSRKPVTDDMEGSELDEGARFVYEAEFSDHDLPEYSDSGSMEVVVYGEDGEMIDLNDPAAEVPEVVDGETDEKHFQGLPRAPLPRDEDEASSDFEDADIQGAAWVPELGAIPGVEVEGADGELTYTSQAYEMLHRLTLDWSCLTIDIFRDNGASERRSFPKSFFFVSGTQADPALRSKEGNMLFVGRALQLVRTRDDESPVAEDDVPDDAEANVDMRRVPIPFAVNKVRACPYPDCTGIVAVWGDEEPNGKANVFIYDLGDELAELGNGLAGTDAERRRARGNTRVGSGRTLTPRRQAMQKLVHPCEGWALAWAPTERMLATGDCLGNIRLFSLVTGPGGRLSLENVCTIAQAHGAYGRDGHSVEDIAFAPAASGELFFSSVGVDGTLRLWDLAKIVEAAKTKKTIRPDPSYTTIVPVSNTDLNAVAWEPHAPFRLAVGADDGRVHVVELAGENPEVTYPRVAKVLEFETKPITSCAFAPYARGVVATASESGSTLLWDVDAQADEEYIQSLPQEAQEQLARAPAELLFVHRGQIDTKDVVWHPQIAHCIITTAEDGVNFWEPFQECIEEEQENNQQQ